MSADELKAQGNAAFAAKDFAKAVDLFTQAIEASPQPNHVLYSNRSGAYASLKQYADAAKDAQECVKINPQWPKGYTRLGAAYHGEGDLLKAYDSYEEALKLDPNNAQAKSGLASVKSSLEREASQDGQTPDLGMGQLFKDPATFRKLSQNPKTAEYMKDPSFMQKLEEFSKNPMAALTGASQDPRIMEAMGVILGIDMQPQADDVNLETKEERKSEPEPAKAKEETVPMEVDEDKKAADAEKAQGNTLYKQRKFPEAIAHYNKAWDLYKDITYLNNRAAAEYEAGDYDTAIATCKEAVEQGKEMLADYKLIAKAFTREGNCYLKQDNLEKAIEAFEHALTEHRSPEVLTKLRTAQKELRVRTEQEYQDPAKAEEARSEGNEHFKKAEYPESVKAYTEAIKRAPKDPRGYGNRAAAFLKLLSYPDAIRDCDDAIKLDPSFFKAYTRKATAYLVMKQFRNAMDTLDEARKIDQSGQHTREIEDLYNKAMTGRFAPLDGETEDQRTERLSQDPEIDEIRKDPIMNTILQQAASDPAALRDHMKNPEVRRKINLLAAAGIIRTR